MLQGWRGHGLALLAGALITPSLAPWNLWPLAILSCTLLAALLTKQTPRQAILRGWCYGLGLFTSGASWVYVSIHVYGYAPVPLALLLTGLFCAGLGLLHSLPAYLYARWLRNLPGGTTLGFASLFVLAEWWRSWFLTGFPWLYLGYGHLNSPLAGWAPVAGVFGISFIIALTGALLWHGISQRHISKPLWASVLAVWLLGAALQQVDWVEDSGKRLPVALVQTNISQDQKWLPEQYQSTLQLYSSMSGSLWPQYPLVVWPEAAIPSYFHNAEPFLESMAAQAAQHGSSLVTGIPYAEWQTDGSIKRYNSIVGLGNAEGRYFKQHLVPFGEYVPLYDYLGGLLRFFELPLSNFSSGSSEQKGIQLGDVQLAPFICYEIVYPTLVAEWLPKADLLITISNDAWFGASIGPLQHLQMAQMRALESGRYLIRATGTGISAIVDERGRIVSRGQQFTREVITGEAKIFSGATPFSLMGNTPIILLCLALIIIPLTISLRANAVRMRD